MQLFAVGKVVAIQVRGIDKDLLLQRRPVVLRQPAVPQRGIEAARLHRFVKINYRVAGGGPREARIRDAAAGKRVEQRGLANTCATHEHDDKQRFLHFKRVALPAQVIGEAMQSSTGKRRDGEAVRAIQPGAQALLQQTQRRRKRSQDRLRGCHRRSHWSNLVSHRLAYDCRSPFRRLRDRLSKRRVEFVQSLRYPP